MSDRPNRNNDQQSPNQSKPPLSRMPKGMVGWVMFFGMAMLLFLLLSQSMQRPNKVDVQQLKTWVSQNRVQKITISGNSMSGVLKPDKDQ
ncbi:MAG TPA: ATP-dependent metallopeptidase FtsH/Yme1/Tma family protein, partial [Tepidisphaeraceae bacterium]|nr:ATP-dependent metallopeptidase FtsH/Yme1/Tma family protein [Tepidisphaeraceae bacterium]